MSTPRVFALIIGIDSYESGRIWNLHSCVDDANGIQSWLMGCLKVPKSQICTLLDGDATKQEIEDCFMEHLTNNVNIERGDAILIYFAGHGSIVPAPADWFHGPAPSANVEVICTYDHDTKTPHGRIAGISDRSMHAMISDLARVKGENITLILDCCFSPPQTRANIRDRSHIRWTATTKAGPDDLYRGLWPTARGQNHTSRLGFCGLRPSTHTLLAACSPGGTAVEEKNGGRFTSRLISIASELPLHRMSYDQLTELIVEKMGDQRPVCLGQHKNQTLFNGVPFVPDAQFLPVALDVSNRLRVEVGAIQGIVEGSELSLHAHHYRSSHNPSIGTVIVTHVYATWSFVESKSGDTRIPSTCWAKVTRWNNRRPFRVKLKSTCSSFFRHCRLRRLIPSKLENSDAKTKLNIVRVKRSEKADISLTVSHRNVIVERHDDMILAHSRKCLKIEKKTGLQVAEDAARFDLHLHCKNPENPLRDLVHMELYRINPSSLARMGNNLFENGQASIPYDPSAIYTVILRNKSDYDLWPYLAYMDPNCYGITMLYHPETSIRRTPLPKGSRLEIGTGLPGSEALSFALSDHSHVDAGFLKLFLSTSPASMGVIEQGPSLAWASSFDRDNPVVPRSKSQTWDTDVGCIRFLRSTVRRRLEELV